MTSPQRQTDDFIKAFRHGNRRCGFLIKEDNMEYGFKFLSGETLANARSNKDIIFSSAGRISDLEQLVPFV